MNAGTLGERPVRRNSSHAGFGGRPAETEQPKDRHRAAPTLLGEPGAGRGPSRHWNELRTLRNQDAKRVKDARWSLLKAPKSPATSKSVTLRRLKAAGGEVWRAYTLRMAAPPPPRSISQEASRAHRSVHAVLPHTLTDVLDRRPSAPPTPWCWSYGCPRDLR